MNIDKYIAHCSHWALCWDASVGSYYRQEQRLRERFPEKPKPDFVFFELVPCASHIRGLGNRLDLYKLSREAVTTACRYSLTGLSVKPLVMQAFGPRSELDSLQHLDLGDVCIINCSGRTLAIREPEQRLRAYQLASGTIDREGFRKLWQGKQSPTMTVFFFPPEEDVGIRYADPLLGTVESVGYHSPADRLIRAAIADGASEKSRFDFIRLTPRSKWETGEYLAVRTATGEGYRWVDFP